MPTPETYVYADGYALDRHQLLIDSPDLTPRTTARSTTRPVIGPMNGDPAQLGLPVSQTGQLNPNELYVDPENPSQRYYLPVYRVAQAKQRFDVSLHLNERPVAGDIGRLQVHLISDERHPDSPATRITFDKFPDGSTVTPERYLQGNEYAAQNVTFAGAPESSYCANGKLSAIRSAGTYGGVTFPFLTTASPESLSHCNGVPIAISFIKPVGTVSLTFAGASVSYTLKAFDAAGRLLGTVHQKAQFGGPPSEITYASTSDNISRVTFGYQAAITAIKEIRFEQAGPHSRYTLSPLPHDVDVHLRYIVAADDGDSSALRTWQNFSFARVNHLDLKEIVAIHPIKSFAELDTIYRVMSESKYRCQLIVHCEADLAYRARNQILINRRIFPTQGHQVELNERALRLEQRPKPTASQAEFLEESASSQLNPAAAQPSATLPMRYFTDLAGRAAYAPVRGRYDQILPFYFAHTHHPYIYPDYEPGGDIKLLRYQVAHDFVLYQDIVQRSLFYYMPEEFRLTRKAFPPYEPAIKVSVTQVAPVDGEGDKADEGSYRFHFLYRAVPYLAPEREQEALNYITTNGLAPEGETPGLMPITPDEARLFLQLPKTGGGVESVERLNAEIVFDQYIVDTVEFDASTFQEIVYSMNSGGESMNGTVKVKLPGDGEEQSIRFNGHLAQMSGLDVEHFLAGRDESDAGQYKIEVTDVIESAIEIHEASISLLANPERFHWVPTTLVGTNWPLALNTGQRSTIRVRPIEPVAYASGSKVKLIQATVSLNFESLWQSILEVPGWDDVTHDVTVTVAAEHLTQSHGPNRVTVSFNRGEEFISLTPAHTSQTVTLTKRLLPYLLRQPNADDYFYQIEAWRDSVLLGRSPILNDDRRDLAIVPPQEVTP